MSTIDARKKQSASVLLIACLSLLVGIGIGIVIVLIFGGNSVGSEQEQHSRVSTDLPEKERDATSREASRSGEQITHFSDLLDRAKFNGRLGRIIALRNFLEGKDVGSLRNFLQDSNQIQHRNLRDETQHEIVLRLAAVDPLNAISLIDELPAKRRSALIDSVYREWALADLNEAVKSASNLDEPAKTDAIAGILWAREDFSETERRELAREIGNERAAIDYYATSMIDDRFEDPEQSWNDYIATSQNKLESLSDSQIDLMSSIAQQWIEQSGLGVVTPIEKSLSNRETLSAVMEGVIASTSLENPDFALSLAMRLPQSMFRHVVLRVISDWAKNDPRAALVAAVAVEPRSLSHQLEYHAIQAWATSDARDLLGHISTLPDHLQETARKEALVAMARTSPQSTLKLLSEVRTQKGKDTVAKAIAVNWARQDFSSAIAWVRSDQHSKWMQNQLLKAVFRELANEDPMAALEYALGQPPDDSSIGFEAEVIDRVAFWDLDTAIAMLPDVRNEETRAAAYESLVSYSVLMGDPERALELALQYAESGKYTVNYQSIFWLIAFRDPEVLFNSVDQIQSASLKSHVAKTLLDQSEHLPTLSRAQLEQLREFIPENPSRQELRDHYERFRDHYERGLKSLEEEGRIVLALGITPKLERE